MLSALTASSTHPRMRKKNAIILLASVGEISALNALLNESLFSLTGTIIIALIVSIIPIITTN